jgi:hypothetical protein
MLEQQRSDAASQSPELKPDSTSGPSSQVHFDAVGGVDVDHATVPQSIPRALAGCWVAWSADGLSIVGSGTTLQDAAEAAMTAGETDPIFERAAGVLRR